MSRAIWRWGAREGGHSRRRIIHTADLTGKEVEHTLVEAVRAHPSITVFEHHFAVDLIVQGRTVPDGAWVLDEATGQVAPYYRRGDICWRQAAPDRSTRSRPTRASRLGTVWRWDGGPGAEVADMEFIQFHPTSLFHPDAKSFLISEAVRGEGGILRRRDGTAFMAEYDAERQGPGSARHRRSCHRQRDQEDRVTNVCTSM